MFLRKRKINNIYYWSIVECYREEGKVKQKVVQNLGNTEKALERLSEKQEYESFLIKLKDFLKVLKGEKQSKLLIIPISLKDANEFVDKFHRHHEPVSFHKFSIAVEDELGKLRGVAIVNRPVARMLDNGTTLEVIRLATDGCPNACSFLYNAVKHTAKSLGYKKIITYTLPEESGISLRAAGWKCVGKAGGGTWNRPNMGRNRIDKHPICKKLRWEVV